MPTLLVVDDSSTIRKLVELTFRNTEWTLEFAASGGEGLSRAKASPPDAILLDFVLPDMRGVDVAHGLSRDPRTRLVPIVVMTAKDDGVRELFHGLSSVREYVQKPFSAEDLQSRVRKLVPPLPKIAASRTEAMAKALFTKLRRPLTMIPSWCAQMGASPPAPFFARKLLTSDVVNEIVEVVLAHVEPSQTKRTEALLAGNTHGFPIADVITLLGASGRTGELALMRGEARTLLYVRGGEIALVTSTDPSGWGRAIDLASVSPDVRAAAESEQRATGKPLVLSLAEHGALPSGVELASAIHDAGRSLLLDVIDGQEMAFAFRELAALPEWVEAYGRAVSMRRRTLLFPPAQESPKKSAASLAAMALDRARAASLETSARPSADVVLDRVRGFSEKVKGLSFDAKERRVLALVDGRWTLNGIARRAGLAEEEVRRIAWCLLEVGLVSSSEQQGARPVLVVDNDIEGFQRPLESLLARRPEPVAVVRVEDEDDLVETALREKPSVVLFDAGGARDAEQTARAFRGNSELRDVALVAVLEVPAASTAPALQAAGFDAVLVKPVAYADLERLIRL